MELTEPFSYELRKNQMRNLLDIVTVLSDLEWQQKAWIENSIPNVWSFWEETMCQFFDDCFIDDFLNNYNPNYGLSGPQVAALWKLRNILDDYCERNPRTMAAKDVLSDPRWHEVVACANETFKAFEGYTVPPESAKTE